MRIALASQSFKNNDVQHNLQVILHSVEALAESADVILFGETFLQGFDSLCWEYEKDKTVALSQEDEVIGCIRAAAKQWGVAVCFGYVERAGEALYSSQLFIGADGGIKENFRRVSPGWKEPVADDHYKEGAHFETFTYGGKSFAIALCGDLWDVTAPRFHQGQEITFWPVYIDFSREEWYGEENERQQYAEKAAEFGGDVLLINSVSEEGHGCALGGCYHFAGGQIAAELPLGSEGLLLVDLPKPVCLVRMGR